MKATNFVVLLFLIVVVCANVGARKLEDVSKETKFEISIPKTVTTNGLGSELGVVVSTYAYHSQYATADAAAGPGGPEAIGTGSTYGSTSGYVSADGSNANAYSNSNAYGQAVAGATATPDGASSYGNGYGDANTNAGGSIGGP